MLSISASGASSANETILRAKELYIEAEKRGDQAAMNAAHDMAEKARRNGGTIGADKSLEQSKQVVQQEKYQAGNPAYSVPAPVPTYSPAQVTNTYNNKPASTPAKPDPVTRTIPAPPTSTPSSAATNNSSAQAKQALDEIGRAQVAYQEYMKAGRPDLAENANKYANEQREKLKNLGVSDSLYNSNVDLRARYQGGQAGAYDPVKSGQAPTNSTDPIIARYKFPSGDGTEEAMRNRDGSTVVTKGNDKGEVITPPLRPEVEARNQEVEQAKIDYLFATYFDPARAAQMKADAEAKARQARDRGATLGADVDTSLTTALKNYLNQNPEIKKALQSKNVADLNNAILRAKNDWIWSSNNNDETGKRAAEKIGQLMRDLGGTIGSDVSLQQARDAVNSSSKGSQPAPTPTGSKTNQAPESESGLYDVVMGAIKGFASSLYDNVIVPTQDPIGLAVNTITGLVNGIKQAYDYTKNGGMSHICQDITNGFQQWYSSYQALKPEEKSYFLGDVSGTLLTVLGTIRKGEVPKIAEAAKAVRVITPRVLDSVVDANIIKRVKELRGALQSDLKRSGNFGYAEVNISGVSKTEFFAHSGIEKITDRGADKIPGLSLQPENPIFKATEAVNREGKVYLRDSDTEYKILNDLAARLGNNTNVSGKVKLFTEGDPCDSCSTVISEFANKYKNIEIEVVHNNFERLRPSNDDVVQPIRENNIDNIMLGTSRFVGSTGGNTGIGGGILVNRGTGNATGGISVEDNKTNVNDMIELNRRFGGITTGNTGIGGGISTNPGAGRAGNLKSIEIIKNTAM
jgi:hypothetical protein